MHCSPGGRRQHSGRRLGRRSGPIASGRFGARACRKRKLGHSGDEVHPEWRARQGQAERHCRAESTYRADYRRVLLQLVRATIEYKAASVGFARKNLAYRFGIPAKAAGGPNFLGIQFGSDLAEIFSVQHKGREAGGSSLLESQSRQAATARKYLADRSRLYSPAATRLMFFIIAEMKLPSFSNCS
jgi:hypothetical protein